jgi:hypothetical protein
VHNIGKVDNPGLYTGELTVFGGETATPQRGAVEQLPESFRPVVFGPFYPICVPLQGLFTSSSNRLSGSRYSKAREVCEWPIVELAPRAKKPKRVR